MTLVALRKAFPYLAFAVLAAALLYATSFGTLPRADLAFNNATEVKTVDPAQATGEPEGRVIEGLFEGLLRRKPAPEAPPPSNRENTPVTPQYAAADDMQVSADGRTYTFRIRQSAKWSDGSPVTAHDFVWSWQRMLHPETVSDYKYQLYYIVGAPEYSELKVKSGDRVEVELADRTNRLQTFPRGTIVRGELVEVLEPKDTFEHIADKAKRELEKINQTIYVVETKGERRSFAAKVAEAKKHHPSIDNVEESMWVLPDFGETVGLQAPDDHTLVIKLKNRTPYFADLVAFYPLYPVNRACVEKYGFPDFCKPENLVCNGPFVMQFRRIRDRVRMVKNPHYWDAANVQLETVDALAITSDVAALNMYETGQLDWVTNVPPTVIPELRERADFYSAPALSTYYYRVNCTRKPCDKKLVRQALNLAVNKQKIVERITRGGEMPATALVPPGMKGYMSPKGPEFDPERAKKLLEEAGYPEGHGMPKIELLYNTHEMHQAIAEVVQDDWKRLLGIDVELRQLEWGSYLTAQQSLEYQVARAGWTGDYLDPNTYLDMFITDGAQNQTGWSNQDYDDLVAKAAEEEDAEKRLALLYRAEQILIEEQPIIPFYYYTTKELVKPHISGFYLNLQKFHPLHFMSVDRPMRDAPGSTSQR